MKDPVDIDLNNHLDRLEKVEAAYESDYYKRCRQDKINEKAAEIAEEGIDCLVNWDILEDDKLAELFKEAANADNDAAWMAFGKQISKAITESARHEVDKMDYEEITGERI